MTKCASCDRRLTADNVSAQSTDTCAECAKAIQWEPKSEPGPTRAEIDSFDLMRERRHH